MSLQLMAEERIGAPRRQEVLQAKALEDATAEAQASVVARMLGGEPDAG